MIGRTISHYRILEKLGEGGMGVVYRAEDTILRRAVALKFLSPRILGTEEHTTRLMHEARAAAALDHQNICTVHEVSEEDGQPFIVMSLIEGESLRERIKRGPLTLAEAINIVSQAAAGLAAAHEVGVIHRDVNPRNIMITPKGQVKIMDFGLAVSAEMTKLTQPGHTAGTAPYMSPEQARGINVDHRTDIWALGVVLHEITTGHRAFRGDSDQAVIYSILNEDPPLPSKLRPELPAALDAVVAKAIAKKTEDRYHSMEELLEDLRALDRGTEVTATIPARVRRFGISRFARPWVSWLGLVAIAALVVVTVRMFLPLGRAAEELTEGRVLVAPFENRTGDPSLDHIGERAATSISEGVAQEDIAEVVACAVEDTGGGQEDIGTRRLLAAARDAGASMLVTGSFGIRSDSLRIAASLLQVPDGTVLSVIPDQVGQVATPEAAISKTRSRVMGALAARADIMVMRDALSHAPTWEAYQAYKAGYEAAGAEALEHFERAAELDPAFTPVRLGQTHNLLMSTTRLTEADSLVRDVLSHPGYLTPHMRVAVEAFAAHKRHDYSEALRRYRELDRDEPQLPWVNKNLVSTALLVNRPHEAIEVCTAELEKAREGNWHVESWVYMKLSDAHHRVGEFERQLEMVREGIEIFPDHLGLRTEEVGALAALGRVDDIDRIIEESASTPVGPEAQKESWGSPFFGDEVPTMRLRAIEELYAHGYTEEAVARAEDLVERLRTRVAIDGETRASSWQLAWALYYAERWEEALALFEQIEPADDTYQPVYQAALGCLAARLGDHARALEIKNAVRTMDTPYEPGVNKYMAGGIAAVLGEREEAMDLLHQALAEGNNVWRYIHQDRDYLTLKDYPPFQRLIEPRD